MTTPDPLIRLVHIGKTGGTFVQTVLRDTLRVKGDPNDPTERDKIVDRRILIQPHVSVEQSDRKRGHYDPLAFTYRDPIDRFVSGFHCRHRMGLPHHNSMWDAGEAAAFAHFSDPNTLAEALMSDDLPRQAAARFSCHAIRHIRRGYGFHFGPVGSFIVDHAPRVLACLDLADMQTQGPAFFKALGYPDIDLGVGKRRRGEADKKSELSGLAQENIRTVFTEEFEYYEIFKDLQKRLLV